MSRIEKLAQALAYYVSHPADAIEIGGLSSQLSEIIKIQTKGNGKLREKVHEWLEFYIEYNDTTIPDYINNTQAAQNEYDMFFYNS